MVEEMQGGWDCKESKDLKYGTFSLFKMDSNARNHSVTLKVLVDLVLLSLFTALLDLFYNHLTPFQRGFFCDDEDIMYPNREEQVTVPMLWMICVLFPTAMILLTEFVQFLKRNDPECEDVFICGWSVPDVFYRIYTSEGVFLFGIIMAEIVANYFKVLVGRMRPNFLDLCKPDFNCSSVSNPHFYVESFECTNPEMKSNNDPRLSFPSGHTAVSTFAMLYTTLYLQRRMHFNFSAILKPLIQLLILCIAVYISLTRIQDNKHHWDDVVGGFIVGLIICLIMVFTQTNLFTEKSQSYHQQSIKQMS